MFLPVRTRKNTVRTSTYHAVRTPSSPKCLLDTKFEKITLLRCVDKFKKLIVAVNPATKTAEVCGYNIFPNFMSRMAKFQGEEVPEHK